MLVVAVVNMAHLMAQVVRVVAARLVQVVQQELQILAVVAVEAQMPQSLAQAVAVSSSSAIQTHS
jgi:hypothetical protein